MIKQLEWSRESEQKTHTIRSLAKLRYPLTTEKGGWLLDYNEQVDVLYLL